MQTDKNQLIARLETHLEQNPIDTKAFLEVVNKNLDRYLVAVTQERNGRAYNGISGLLTILSSKEAEKDLYIPFALDAFVYLLPKGWDSLKGECAAVKKGFKTFLEKAEAYEILKHKDWLQNQRNCWDWVDKVFNDPLYAEHKKALG